MKPFNIFVGTDMTQRLAFEVLKYSIIRHTELTLDIIPLIDLNIPVPKDPNNRQRTGFSFSRFCIPKCSNYQGKALYLDTDMLVFNDIRDLINIPFNGAKVLIQEAVKYQDISTQKQGAPKKRLKQTAVMLLDCEKLSWDIQKIICSLDAGKYNYHELMFDLALLDESEIRYSIPSEWNSLEYYDENTSLLHYTDVSTQPWVSPTNKYVHLWLDELRRMLKEGVIDFKFIKNEIQKGHVRPSLLTDLKYRQWIPKPYLHKWDKRIQLRDKSAGYIKHKAVYETKRERNCEPIL